LTVGDSLARTRRAVALTVERRDGRAVVGGVAALYLLIYLYAVGHLSVAPGRTEVDAFVVADPLVRMFQQTGPLTFEPVARVVAGPVSFLFAPLTLLVGGVLAALVGLNLGVSYLLWRRPERCGLSPSKSVLASVPALLSGSACCGPVVLIVLGVQATGALLTVFAWLTPAAAVLLAGTLVVTARNVAPA
jgi:hypothetical protein